MNYGVPPDVSAGEYGARGIKLSPSTGLVRMRDLDAVSQEPRELEQRIAWRLDQILNVGNHD